MLVTAELAGFFAAHAVSCVSEGETLTPMIGSELADGSRHLHRIMADELSEAVAQGQEWLEENPESASRAVLVYDAFVTLESGRTDALIVEARRFVPAAFSFTMAVPYRPAKRRSRFAVHSPKLLDIAGPEDRIPDIVEAFFRGVDQDEKGAAVWNLHLDESV